MNRKMELLQDKRSFATLEIKFSAEAGLINIAANDWFCSGFKILEDVFESSFAG
jgi:hypothetical protein